MSSLVSSAVQRIGAIVSLLYLVLDCIFARVLPVQTVNIRDLSGRQIIITGVSEGGIGYEVALKLARAKATLIVCARNVKEANEGRDAILRIVKDAKIEVVDLDVSSLASVKAFADKWSQRSGNQIDALLCNAGIATYKHQRSVDDFEMTYATNFLGHFALTLRLLPFMSRDGRIVYTSSLATWSARGLTPDRLNSQDVLKGYPVGTELPPRTTFQLYARTKAQQAMLAVELSRRLQVLGSKVSVFAVYPGIVKSKIWAAPDYGVDLTTLTSLVARHGISPEAGSVTLTWVATEPSLARRHSGSFFHRKLALYLPQWVVDPDTSRNFFDRWQSDSGISIADLKL